MRIVYFLVIASIMLCASEARAQYTLRIEWEFTVPGGCPRMPLDILMLGGLHPDGLRIYKDPSYNYTGSVPYLNNTYSKSYFVTGSSPSFGAIWTAVGYKNDQGKCPGLGAGLPCYKDMLTTLNYSTTDFCKWTETTVTVCGFANFKVRINVSPNEGLPMVQTSTPKGYYCANDVATFEAPCNIKNRATEFRWYKIEGTGWGTLVKTTTTGTFNVGAGQDLVPTPGVNTRLYVVGTFQDATGYNISMTSGNSPTFRYGASPPTATVTPQPPKCADGSDWSIDFTGVANANPTITSFKANVFHSSNSTAFPDGYVIINGSSKSFTLADVVSSRTFAPGTQFRVTVQNDYDPTTYGACESSYGPYTIPNKAKLTISENTVQHHDLSCYNVLTGGFQLNVTNGDGGSYTVFLGSTSVPIKAGSLVNQPSVENLDGGTYSVKLRDTYCESDAITVVLTEPGELLANITIEKPLDCGNSNDGILKVNVSGGSTPYAINWSSGSTDATAGGLSKGLYTVTVKDQGCPLLTRSETLTAPAAIVVNVTETPPKCPNGQDGSIVVTDVVNAPGTLTYLWDSGETSSQLLGIPKGDYAVTVTSLFEGKTCKETKTINLKDPIPWTATLKPVLTYNGAAISCFGKEDGRIDVVVKNDLGQEVDGEFYTWSTGESGNAKKYIDELGEGTYDITVRYRGVCEAVASLPLTAPRQFVAMIQGNSNFHDQLISCAGKTDASLKVATDGGTGLPAAFTYAWSTGATTPVISGLGAGVYTLAVKDANQCLATATLEVKDPAPVEASIAAFSKYIGDFGVSCNGLSNGSITAQGDGGTGEYTYVWSNGKNTAAITGLPAGDYTVTVADENNCPATTNHTLTQPAVVTLARAPGLKKEVSCFGGADGSITLVATGGTEQYEYSRDNMQWSAPATLTGFSIGTYRLRVHDENGCAAAIDETFTQPTALGLSFKDIAPAFCSNAVGTATGEVTGGVGNYQYAWHLGNNASVLGTDAILSNQPAGIYRLSVRDGNGCPIENTVAISSTDGAKISYTAVDTRCFDSADGSAQMTVEEGDGPFTILWPDGQSALQGVNLKKGMYLVSITDGHDCQVIEQLEVKGPEPIALQVNDNLPSCYTFCDGAITLQAVGGVGGYSYAWNNSTGATQTQLCAASYPVRVTDANGCLLLDEVTLGQPDPITVNAVTTTLATCKDGCDGALTVQAAGGNGGYQYTWAVGGNTTAKTNLCPSDYAISIVDQKGCTGAGVVPLPNTPALPLDLGGGVTLCVGQSYTLNAGNQWKSIQWGSNAGLNSTDPVITTDVAGSYWVDVINDDGCVAQDTFLLQTSYDLLQAQFMITSEAVVGDTVVMIEISWPVPQSIEWTYPLEMRELVNLGDVIYGQFSESGSYDVTLTAHLGECVDQITKTVTILDNAAGEEDGRLGYEDFVKHFTLYPNPNNGSFDVGVELADESAITLSVWNAATSVLVGKVQDNGRQEYTKHVDLRPLAPGAYVLRLDYEGGKRFIRFVVH